MAIWHDENGKRRYKGNGHVPYLRERRGRWFVQVPVPKPLQHRFGQTVETYLGTGEKSTARGKASAAVAEILASFERAREGGSIRPEELKATAETELRRAYDALAADFLESHGKLPQLASEVAEDSGDLTGASWQTNRLLGMPVTDYAAELLDRIGAEKSEETIEELSHSILKAQAAAIAMLQKGMEPAPQGPAHSPQPPWHRP